MLSGKRGPVACLAVGVRAQPAKTFRLGTLVNTRNASVDVLLKGLLDHGYATPAALAAKQATSTIPIVITNAIGRSPLSEIYSDLILARLMPSGAVHTNRIRVSDFFSVSPPALWPSGI
jgi:hypothetical protein